MTHRRRVTAGRLLVTEQALVVDAEAVLRGQLEIPWKSIRKAVVDDGTLWGYVSGVCRFPVYDLHADGSGSGALIGPLWSQGSSLMPPACPVEALDPVPAQSPNVALIFEPYVSSPAPRERNGGPRAADSIATLLLCADDPHDAREALAARLEVGNVDHDDLEYLNRAAGLSQSGNGASGNGASGNGASSKGQSGNGASASSVA